MNSAVKTGWLERIWQRLVVAHPGVSEIGARRRAQLLAALTLLILLSALLGLAVVWSLHGFWYSGTLAIIGTTAAALLAYALSRSRYFNAGAFLLITGLCLPAYWRVLSGVPEPERTILTFIPLAQVLANLLLSARWQVVTTLLNALVIFCLPVYVPALNAMQAGGMVLTLGFLLFFATLFRNSLEKMRLAELSTTNQELRSLKITLEAQVAERTSSAEAARAQAESALEQAEAARRTLEARSWISTGQARLSEVLRADSQPLELAENVLRSLCQYLSAQAGVLFLADGDDFRWAGGYGCAPEARSAHFKRGEGLTGQAAKDGRLRLHQTPPGYLSLVSGLGDAPPAQVLIAPLSYAGEVLAVIELAALEAFQPQAQEFMSQVSEAMALGLRSAQTRRQLQDALAETRRQAEELQAQDEELRAVNEELEAQAEQLRGALETRTNGAPARYARRKEQD